MYSTFNFERLLFSLNQSRVNRHFVPFILFNGHLAIENRAGNMSSIPIHSMFLCNSLIVADLVILVKVKWLEAQEMVGSDLLTVRYTCQRSFPSGDGLYQVDKNK